MVMTAQQRPSAYTSLSDAIANVPRHPNVPELGGKVLSKLVVSTGLDQELAAKGFRSFRPLFSGSMGVVLETTNHQVIRICISGDRPHKDLSLFRAKALPEIQAIKRCEKGALLYEILQQLPQHHNDNEALEYLQENLSERGYLHPHFKSDGLDVGYLQDGTPMLLDPDAMDPTETYGYDSVKDAAWVVAAPGKKSKQFAFLPEGIISKQEYYCEALMDGRARGVLTDDDRVVLETLKDGRLYGGLSEKEKLAQQTNELEALRAERPDCFKGVTLSNLPKFMKYVFDKGMYPEQAVTRIQETSAGKMGVPFTQSTSGKLEGRLAYHSHDVGIS